jgi:hypothetical protein
MGQESCETETEKPAKDVSGDKGNGGNEEEAPNPDGTFTTRCDYQLGDFTESESGYRFVAGGTLKNTGNVGIVAKFKATWQILGTSPVVETRTIRLKPGRSRQVQVTRVATQNEIDGHQSADGECKTTVNIVDSFGKP